MTVQNTALDPTCSIEVSDGTFFDMRLKVPSSEMRLADLSEINGARKILTSIGYVVTLRDHDGSVME